MVENYFLLKYTWSRGVVNVGLLGAGKTPKGPKQHPPGDGGGGGKKGDGKTGEGKGKGKERRVCRY